jgi:hypothetical protein
LSRETYSQARLNTNPTCLFDLKIKVFQSGNNFRESEKESSYSVLVFTKIYALGSIAAEGFELSYHKKIDAGGLGEVHQVFSSALFVDNADPHGRHGRESANTLQYHLMFGMQVRR